MSQSPRPTARFVRLEPTPTQSETSEASVSAELEAEPTGESGAGLADVRARIAAVDRAAADYLHTHRPAHTTRAYAGDAALWRHYTAAVGVPPTAFSPGLLTGFAVWLETGAHRADAAPAAPATIRRRVYGAVAALREAGVTVPAGAATPANEAIKAYERRLAHTGARRGRGPAPALTVQHLRAICAELPTTLAGTRDRAVLLLGFATAARRDELAHLHVTDIADDPHGLVITIRHSKTGTRTVAVPHGRRAATCPVRAWHTWRDAAGLSEGRALRGIDRHGRIAASITAGAIGTLVSTAADRAGLLVHVTAHSLRAGLATEARRAGHDPLTIARQGGWADGSTVLFGYMRIIDQWDDNALDNIGL
ncbi:MAG: tyrosine-type recombinase/integrase [Actinomycetota bacterium]